MKQILFIMLLGTLAFVSCTTTRTLYSWNNYDQTSYDYLKNSDEKSLQALIETYQNIIEKQTGTRKTIPPGIYADYGFVLLQSNQTEMGKEMLKQEIALYPESKVLIDRILKLFEK